VHFQASSCNGVCPKLKRGRALRVPELPVRAFAERLDGGGNRGATAVESQGRPECAQEGSMKGYFKKEAKFLLLWLLGFPLFVIAVGLIATFFITH
jgi:hypothetical protein